MGFPERINGSYNSSIIVLVFSFEVPTTTLSGFIKSSTAIPSLRNSGFEATSNSKSGAYFLTAARTLSEVPTGTVLLSTSILNPISGLSLKNFPRSSATPNTYFKSALPSPSCGVGRHKNKISEFRIALCRFVVKVRRPYLIFLSKRISRPGS